MTNFATLDTTLPTSQDAVTLRSGIFLAASRTYGETYIEPMIRKVLGLNKPNGGDHDAVDASSGEKYEIKSAKVLTSRAKLGENASSLFDAIATQATADPLSRIISFKDRKEAVYDANIQNVKRDHFDKLIYNLLYAEGIAVFCISSDDISKENIPNWSDKHGRYDALGKSGQFNIKNGTIALHEQKYALKFLSWEELVPFYKDINEKDSN
jgi:hypothetical protein